MRLTGGGCLIKWSDAEQFIRQCDTDGLMIIGVEVFRAEDDLITPDSDLIGSSDSLITSQNYPDAVAESVSSSRRLIAQVPYENAVSEFNVISEKEFMRERAQPRL